LKFCRPKCKKNKKYCGQDPPSFIKEELFNIFWLVSAH